MDKFEERYKLGEIHRRRMEKKHGWGFSFARRISADTAYEYLKDIDDVNILRDLLNLILGYLKNCQGIDVDELLVNILFDDSESEGIEDPENIEDIDVDELIKDINNTFETAKFNINTLRNDIYKMGKNYVKVVKKFIEENKTNCDELVKLCKFILLKIKDLTEDTYDELKYNNERAFELFEGGNYNYHYGNSRGRDHGRDHGNDHSNCHNDYHRGFNHEKYNKARLHHMLMNEQSEYF